MTEWLTGVEWLAVLICVLCVVLCRSYFRRIAKLLKRFNDDHQ